MDTLAAVLHKEPDLSGVPERLQSLLDEPVRALGTPKKAGGLSRTVLLSAAVGANGLAGCACVRSFP